MATVNMANLPHMPDAAYQALKKVLLANDADAMRALLPGQTHLDLCHTSRPISPSKIFTKFTLNDLLLKIDFVDFRSKLC